MNTEIELIPFTVLGYPDEQAFLQSIDIMVECGASTIELGLPFSDPIADGPVIERASRSMVSRGFTTDDAIRLVGEVRSKHQGIKLVLLAYYNCALARGPAEFLSEFKSAGIDAVIFVDLPIEEAQSAIDASTDAGLLSVPLVTPFSGKERLKAILGEEKEQERGLFIYLVSRSGVTGRNKDTGAGSGFAASIEETIKDLKALSRIPIMVGFGVRSAEHAYELRRRGADGVIVGSAIVEIMEETRGSGEDELGTRLSRLLLELKSACALGVAWKTTRG